jgi:hypothetical protein
MLRRTILKLLPTSLLQLRTAPTRIDLADYCNPFSHAYNDWIAFLIDKGPPSPGTLDAEGLKRWREAEKEWKRLDKIIKMMYQ